MHRVVPPSANFSYESGNSPANLLVTHSEYAMQRCSDATGCPGQLPCTGEAEIFGCWHWHRCNCAAAVAAVIFCSPCKLRPRVADLVTLSLLHHWCCIQPHLALWAGFGLWCFLLARWPTISTRVLLAWLWNLGSEHQCSLPPISPHHQFKPPMVTKDPKFNSRQESREPSASGLCSLEFIVSVTSAADHNLTHGLPVGQPCTITVLS